MFKLYDHSINLEYREYPLNEKFPIFALLNGEFTFQPSLLTDLTFLHFHNCVEIGIIHKGNYLLYVEDQCFSLQQGDIFFLPPYTMHIGIPDDQDNITSCEYLYLLPDVLLHDFFQDYIPDTLLPYQFENFPVSFSSSSYPEIYTSVALLLDILREQKINYDIEVKGLVLTLMAELSRTLPKHAQYAPDNEILPILLPALHYVNQHYSSNLSIDFLAELCHISTSHFHKLFKHSLKQSPTHYIQHIRLSKACELLHNTEDTILMIAFAVGFTSLSNFNKQFQKRYHQTPRQWRNANRIIQKKNFRHSVFPINPRHP